MYNYKQLDGADRAAIEAMLRGRSSLKEIAVHLGKSHSTISREVRRHRLPSDKYPPHRIHNRCIERGECIRQFLCPDKINCVKRCRSCNSCNSQCPDFKEEVCGKLSCAPYVCNGCADEHRCILKKRYYLHAKAHEAYREMLSESRRGANITEGELLDLDELVSPLIRQGQSPWHIVANNPDSFNVSEKTIYRYVSSGLLKAKNIDLPRVVRIKPRNSKPVEHKVDAKCRIGRNYTEYLSYTAENQVAVVEMDSVIGRIGGKALLTLMFKSCDFMLAFLRERNTSQSVIDKFNMLYGLLGAELFMKLFPLLLTDNGSEFSNPKALEFDSEGRRRTRVYYCDPGSSFQKPNVELNHEFIRRILPKGSSFDSLTQNNVDVMMSHINSYSRDKLSGKAPFEMFGFLYGEKTPILLGQRRIPANEILLKPSLLKK